MLEALCWFVGGVALGFLVGLRFTGYLIDHARAKKWLVFERGPAYPTKDK